MKDIDSKLIDVFKISKDKVIDMLPMIKEQYIIHNQFKIFHLLTWSLAVITIGFIIYHAYNYLEFRLYIVYCDMIDYGYLDITNDSEKTKTQIHSNSKIGESIKVHMKKIRIFTGLFIFLLLISVLLSFAEITLTADYSLIKHLLNR